MQEISNAHALDIQQQKSVTATGIDGVLSFSETQIVLMLSGGNTKLYITGTGMKITGFSKTSGTFTATGNIAGIKYGGKSLKARLFR